MAGRERRVKPVRGLSGGRRLTHGGRARTIRPRRGSVGGRSRSSTLEPRIKTAVVTGAAQGLGLATASMLAQRAFRVVLIDVQGLDGQLARLRAAGLRVDGISGDVSSEPFGQQGAARISSEGGAPDVLGNNAGTSLYGPAAETP